IGSLAKDLKEEGVQNITVKKTIFLGTQNGLRIKSWSRPSTGFVQGIRLFELDWTGPETGWGIGLEKGIEPVDSRTDIDRLNQEKD
ncbi:hypothetical protein Gogos_000169, partial [Gossypium gossypioides]|nr:hypothetical protein [Gossypium gossypioides]